MPLLKRDILKNSIALAKTLKLCIDCLHRDLETNEASKTSKCDVCMMDCAKIEFEYDEENATHLKNFSPLTVPSLEDVPIHADGEYTVTINEQQKETEKVSHPNHYNKGIEVWDYIISHDMNFIEGNIIKYVSRYKHKNGIEDLKKAIFYLDKLIEVVEKENDNE